ncbi:hypothetical protein D3C71_496930 [compost metagenome]
MDLPSEITLPIKFHSDGTLDESSLLLALEAAVGNRIRITDWVGESHIREEYPHLDEEQRIGLISSIEIGEYDYAINQDTRQTVLNEAAVAAGVPRWEGDDGADEDDDDDNGVSYP